MRVFFNPDQDLDWDSFFASQIGSGPMPYYEGEELQYGNGVIQTGGFGFGPFQAHMRMMLPVFKRVGKAIRNEALATGGRVAADYITGKPLKQAVKRQARRGLHNLAVKAAANLADELTEQSGSGKRRRRRRALPKAKAVAMSYVRLPGGLVVQKTRPVANKRIVPLVARKVRPAKRVSVAHRDYLGFI
jgi:hypothetical protein